MSDEPTFSVNNRSLTFSLSLIAVATALYTGISTMNAYGYQVDKIQADQIELSTSVRDLNTQVQGLNSNITNLTIVLNRIEDRYEALDGRVKGVEDAHKRK